LKYLIFILIAIPLFSYAGDFKVQCKSNDRVFSLSGNTETKQMSIIDISNGTKNRMEGDLSKFTVNYDIQSYKIKNSGLELKGVLTHETGKSYISIDYYERGDLTIQTAALSNALLAHALMEFKSNCVSLGIE
jgi:hypothetical protein